MTDIVNFIASLAPVYFYFLPYSLVTIFYERFIDESFDEIIGDVDDGYYRRKIIKSNMTNMITFLSFISVFIGSYITIIYALVSTSQSIKNHIGICLLIHFVVGVYLLVQNLSKKLKLSKIELILQHLLVILTSVFIYLYL